MSRLRKTERVSNMRIATETERDELPGADDEPEADQPMSPEPPSLLVNIRQLAMMLSRSVTCLHRDDAAGRLPEAIRMSSAKGKGAKRWRRDEIREWVAV